MASGRGRAASRAMLTTFFIAYALLNRPNRCTSSIFLVSRPHLRIRGGADVSEDGRQSDMSEAEHCVGWDDDGQLESAEDYEEKDTSMKDGYRLQEGMPSRHQPGEEPNNHFDVDDTVDSSDLAGEAQEKIDLADVDHILEKRRIAWQRLREIDEVVRDADSYLSPDIPMSSKEKLDEMIYQHKDEESESVTDNIALPVVKPRNITLQFEGGQKISAVIGNSFEYEPHPYLLESPSSDSVLKLPKQDYTIDELDKACGPLLWKARFGTEKAAEMKANLNLPIVPLPRKCMFWSSHAGPELYHVSIIGDPKTRNAVVIDPSGDVGELYDVISHGGLNIVAILLTNGFFFKSTGLFQIWQKTNKPPIYLGRLDRDIWDSVKLQPGYLVKSWGDGVYHHVPDVPKITNWLDDGDKIPLNGTAIHLPGMSDGSFGFYWKDFDLVAVGDVIQDKTQMGNCRYKTSDAATLKKSITQKLFSLPSHTIVLPAVGDLSTVEIEKNFNPLIPLNETEEERAERLEEKEWKQFTSGAAYRKRMREYQKKEEKYNREGYIHGFNYSYKSPKSLRIEERAKRWRRSGYFPKYLTKAEYDHINDQERARVYTRISQSTDELEEELDARQKKDKEIIEKVRSKPVPDDLKRQMEGFRPELSTASPRYGGEDYSMGSSLPLMEQDYGITVDDADQSYGLRADNEPI